MPIVPLAGLNDEQKNEAIMPLSKSTRKKFWAKPEFKLPSQGPVCPVTFSEAGDGGPSQGPWYQDSDCPGVWHRGCAPTAPLPAPPPRLLLSPTS